MFFCMQCGIVRRGAFLFSLLGVVGFKMWLRTAAQTLSAASVPTSPAGCEAEAWGWLSLPASCCSARGPVIKPRR